MEQLIFDTGVKEYQLPGGVLRFNPSDPNVYDRFMSCLDEIKAVEQQMSAKAQEVSGEKTEENAKRSLQIMRETDVKFKAILNDAFGHGNDFDKLLDGVNLMAIATNGERVIANLLNALQPIMEAGAKTYVNAEVDAAKLNREQRRAAGR